MNFSIFIQFFVLLQIFLIPGFLSTRPRQRHSLVVTIKDNKAELTKPTSTSEDYGKIEFKAPGEGKTFHFCPSTSLDLGLEEESEEQSANVLIPTEYVKPNDITDDLDRCYYPNRPVLLKVTNPKELRNNWNDHISVQLYHYTFMLNIAGIDKKKPVYEFWTSNYYISLLGIEIFYNTSTGQTLAVSYEVLSVPEDYGVVEYPLYYYESFSSLKNPDFMDFINENHDLEFLEMKLGDEVAKYTNGREENLFILAALAPSTHFITGLSAISSLTQLNLFPMWRKTNEKWEKVESFIKRLSSSIGDLTVTAGTIGVMKLPISKSKQGDNDDINYSESLKSNNPEGEKSEQIMIPMASENDDFAIPEYVWKAVEFEDRGILVIMHLNPFVPTPRTICEEDVGKRNGWDVSNSDFSTGEIYSCDMTNENIGKLQADFLSLTEKKPFALKIHSGNKLILD